MLDTIECEICGRTLRAGPGAASHMRSMHPETLKHAAVASVPPPSSNGSSLVWEEPPARGRSGSLVTKLGTLVVKLQERPGSWARLHTFTGKTSASGMRKKVSDAFPAYEFRCGRYESGSAIWGRYVEDDS